jgi:hypothetical protein
VPDQVRVRVAGWAVVIAWVAGDGWSIVGGVLKRGRDVSARVQ